MRSHGQGFRKAETDALMLFIMRHANGTYPFFQRMAAGGLALAMGTAAFSVESARNNCPMSRCLYAAEAGFPAEQPHLPERDFSSRMFLGHNNNSNFSFAGTYLPG